MWEDFFLSNTEEHTGGDVGIHNVLTKDNLNPEGLEMEPPIFHLEDNHSTPTATLIVAY